MDLEKKVTDAIIKLIKLASTILPSDVKDSLKRSRDEETSEVAKKQLDAILLNIELAEKTETPMCQDTGIVMFYLKAGTNFPIINKLPQILREATKKATKTIPLRPNAVDPFTRKNSGDNTGKDIPCIDWQIISGDHLELTVAPKGYGSENMCTLKMLTPGESVKGLKRFVIDTVIKAGGKPCPPIILGVGVGGGADSVMKLARKAVLRSINKRHENPELANLEEELLKLVNKTGIGPMGLGGKTTALGVNIEYAHTHTAGLPVGVVVSCWASRKASARIRSDGQIEYLTHRGA
jgi:fumarate hydratase subunit alpha